MRTLQPLGTFSCTVRDGVLLNVPVVRAGATCRNWCAIIHRIPREKTLGRRYVFAGPADGIYAADELTQAAPVEFGADIIGRSGRLFSRWYGVVRRVSPVAVDIERYRTARQAIRAAEASGWQPPAAVEGGRHE